MTFDVALWFVPADARLASACAGHLARRQLRVTLVPCGRSAQHRAAGLSFPLARANAAVVGPEGASAWICAPPVPALWFDPDLVTLVGPGIATGMKRQLMSCLSGPTWELSAAGQDTMTWNTISGSLLEIGYARETYVEARSSLAPPKLKQMTISSYDLIAEQFSEHWFNYPPHRELEHFLQRLAPNSSVLDAGCGPGHHARLIASEGHDVVAVDLSDGMLAQARKRVHSVRFLKMDMHDLKFVPGTFDAVWCSAAMHHVPREQVLSVLAGFRRVLKTGGLLGLNFQVGRLSELVERDGDRRFFEYPRHPGAMADLLRASGFTVEGQVYSTDARNTHGLDMLLKWSTLYARSALRPNRPYPVVTGQDGLAQIEFGFTPGDEVHVIDSR